MKEEDVSQGMEELLIDSRRLPEVVIILNCSQESTFDRQIDRDALQAKHDAQMEKFIDKINRERAKARAEKETELN